MNEEQIQFIKDNLCIELDYSPGFTSSDPGEYTITLVFIDSIISTVSFDAR